MGTVEGFMEEYGLEMDDLWDYAEEYGHEECLGHIMEEMGIEDLDDAVEMFADHGDDEDHEEGPWDFVDHLMEEMDGDDLDEAIEALGEDGFDDLLSAMDETVGAFMEE